MLSLSGALYCDSTERAYACLKTYSELNGFVSFTWPTQVGQQLKPLFGIGVFQVLFATHHVKKGNNRMIVETGSHNATMFFQASTTLRVEGITTLDFGCTRKDIAFRVSRNI